MTTTQKCECPGCNCQAAIGKKDAGRMHLEWPTEVDLQPLRRVTFGSLPPGADVLVDHLRNDREIEAFLSTAKRH